MLCVPCGRNRVLPPGSCFEGETTSDSRVFGRFIAASAMAVPSHGAFSSACAQISKSPEYLLIERSEYAGAPRYYHI